MRSHTKFGPDRFIRLDVYWIQANRQAKYIHSCIVNQWGFTIVNNKVQFIAPKSENGCQPDNITQRVSSWPTENGVWSTILCPRRSYLSSKVSKILCYLDQMFCFDPTSTVCIVKCKFSFVCKYVSLSILASLLSFLHQVYSITRAKVPLEFSKYWREKIANISPRFNLKPSSCSWSLLNSFFGFHTAGLLKNMIH